MFYLMIHSTHFYLRLFGVKEGRKEFFLFNTLIKFILWLFMVEHMVKDHSD